MLSCHFNIISRQSSFLSHLLFSFLSQLYLSTATYTDRDDISGRRTQWKQKQRTYDAIPSIARRQATWESDRQEMEEEIVLLTEQRDVDMERLHEERRRRLEKSVRPLATSEEDAASNQGNYDNRSNPDMDSSSLKLTPLDNYLDDDEYMAEEEGEEEEDDTYMEQQQQQQQQQQQRKERSDAYIVDARGTSASMGGRSPRSLTRQSRKDNLERSPQAAAFAAGLDAARHAIAIGEGQEEQLASDQERARTYNAAIRAAASASEISTQIEDSLRDQQEQREAAAEQERKAAQAKITRMREAMQDMSSLVQGVQDVSSKRGSPVLKKRSSSSGSGSGSPRRGSPRSSNINNNSYDEAIISLLQRAKVSGVDWSQMFEVTDRDGTGEIRERDFREAMVSCSQRKEKQG